MNQMQLIVLFLQHAYLWLYLLPCGEGCYGEFTVELRGTDIQVSSVCRGSCSGILPDGVPCAHTRLRLVQPDVQTHTCLQPTVQEDNHMSVNMSHTIVARLTQSDCSSGVTCVWKLRLPESFLEASCIYVHVAAIMTSVSLKGVRKKIWTSLEEPLYSFTCDEECAVLDTSFYENKAAVALILDGSVYSLQYMLLDSHSSTTLPSCLGETGLFQWTEVTNDSCSDIHRSFIPIQAYAVPLSAVFITATNALLYIPCRGCQFYQLLLPVSENISSFAHSSEGLIAILTANSETVGLWMGIAEHSPVLRVYPNAQLMWLWSDFSSSSNSSEAVSVESLLSNGALALDEQNNIMIVNQNSIVPLPLPLSLLISHAVYEYQLKQAGSHHTSLATSLQLQEITELRHQILADLPHPIVIESQFNHLCPLARILVAAPVCGESTRSQLVEAEGRGVMEPFERNILPWINCTVMADSLPTDIFLGLGSIYTFTVDLVINPLLAAYISTGDLYIVHSVSQPGVVKVASEGTLNSLNSTIKYEVKFVENANSSQEQVPSGTVLGVVDIELQVQDIGPECIDPLSPRLWIPGRFKTRVVTGCPPGLYLIFDAATTQSRSNQYCTNSANISCYYFKNRFFPEFQLVDLVTGNRSTYTGPYTLRILAGGTSRANMRSFVSSNIASKIWSARDDSILRHNNNRIEWKCYSNGPCGEVIPEAGRTPEYFLHLQASNREVDRERTYCDFTIQFTIRIHGMRVGPRTSIVIVTVFLFLMVTPLLFAFPVWLWREELWKKWERLKRSRAEAKESAPVTATAQPYAITITEESIIIQ